MKKKKTSTTNTVKWRFFNLGKQYICTIIFPKDILEYRIKDIFRQEFVGKSYDTSTITNPFIKLNKDIICTVEGAINGRK